jgi:hypothetical protein
MAPFEIEGAAQQIIEDRGARADLILPLTHSFITLDKNS